jgi:hypothetical protein
MRRHQRAIIHPGPVAAGKVRMSLSTDRSRVRDGGVSNVNVLLNLQRSHGNAFVQRLVQRKPALSQPGDRYEQEADRLASQVLSTPDAAAASSMQRAIAPEDDKDRTLQTKPVALSTTPVAHRQIGKNDEEDKSIRAKTAGLMADSFEAGADVERHVELSKGRGSPLPDAVPIWSHGSVPAATPYK